MQPEGGKVKFDLPLPQAGCTSAPARVTRSLLAVVRHDPEHGHPRRGPGDHRPDHGIAEPHLLEFIQQRLRDKERTGELQRLIEEARNRGVAAVRQPAPVEGVRSTETARSWTIDPTFTLDRNIVDAQGRLLFPAGTRKNPLEVVSLSKRLLFFDARDGRQVARARELIARYDGRSSPS